jgi:hypothetical protein
MLVYYMLMFVLYFIHLFIMGIGHGLAHVHLCSDKDRSLSCLRHPFGNVIFSFCKFPIGFSSLAYSFL